MNAPAIDLELTDTPATVESVAAGELVSAMSASSFRLRTASAFDVESRISRPGVNIAIHRYRWDKRVDAARFHFDAYYLDLALIRRPAEVEVGYLGRSNRRVFAASGACCFVPPEHEMLVRCPEAEHRVLACLIDRQLLDPYIDWEWTPLELAACFDINNLNIRSALARLAEEVVNPGFASDVLVDANVSALAVELSRYFRATRTGAEQASGKLSFRQLRHIEELIEATPGPFPSVAWLASHCGFSGRHLTRIFKNTTGRTLGEFIAEVRVTRAKRRLTEHDCLIKEVAYECGFQSQSAFAQAFRRATGLTPQQFRRDSLG